MKRKIYNKVGNKWSYVHETAGASVYQSLTNDLINHYMHKGKAIKRITDKLDYHTNMRIVTVYYTGSVKAVYEIQNA